ncbi:uncharacterized protein LOC127547308 [Antechinus flavipes]|uniref:uncharacterized protein LOC127547308 n=1 Tax=Antechinus flavipes TaxID=38775 RepID=UPI0022365AB9|nr:uncharacterized protein LOC127547308 [Antechinus flavipes]
MGAGAVSGVGTASQRPNGTVVTARWPRPRPHPPAARIGWVWAYDLSEGAEERDAGAEEAAGACAERPGDKPVGGRDGDGEPGDTRAERPRDREEDEGKARRRPKPDPNPERLDLPDVPATSRRPAYSPSIPTAAPSAPTFRRSSGSGRLSENPTGHLLTTRPAPSHCCPIGLLPRRSAAPSLCCPVGLLPHRSAASWDCCPRIHLLLQGAGITGGSANRQSCVPEKSSETKGCWDELLERQEESARLCRSN